jgi:nucleotide-binding universal stress UspA family protein
MPLVVVSYDGTRNDRDALALGRLFAHAGAKVTLAYVRHSPDPDAHREAAAQTEAENLLAVGAAQLNGSAVEQRVIFHSSTAEGLAALVAELGADVIAFGSSYRTPPGHVDVPHTAEQLLERGIACSMAIAPAGLRREPVEQSIGTVSVYEEDGDPAAQETATSLARALGATVTTEEADLLVVASRAAAPPGQLLISGVALERLQEARCPVLLLARGTALSFA